MTYAELKGYMRDFHLGEISKTEMAFAIGIWQRGGAQLD
jgi:hypothetical protein